MGNQINSDMKQLLNLYTEQKPIKPADIRKQLVHEILRSILNGREGRGQTTVILRLLWLLLAGGT